MQLPAFDLSKKSLFNFAATVSLLLTIAQVLWSKLAEFVALVWHDVTAALVAFAGFILR